MHPFWWVLPVAAGMIGIGLLRKAEVRTALLAWFVAIAALACVAWACFALVAVYLVETDFYLGR